MGKLEIEEANSEGIAATAAGWRTAVLTACITASACGGRALVGSLACGDSDSGGRSSDASDTTDALACAPPPCPILGGAWQLGGGEFMCTNGPCSQVIPTCTPGAIRFDPTGALLRLTSAGWESACGFATCGDRVTGALLPSILTANYSAIPGDPSRPCGPNWDLFVVGSSLDADASSLDAVDASTFPPTCSLNAYAVCAGEARASNGPQEFAPWSVEVNYSRCTP
jgi:hypothetical protein